MSLKNAKLGSLKDKLSAREEAEKEVKEEEKKSVLKNEKVVKNQKKLGRKTRK